MSKREYDELVERMAQKMEEHTVAAGIGNAFDAAAVELDARVKSDFHASSGYVGPLGVLGGDYGAVRALTAVSPQHTVNSYAALRAENERLRGALKLVRGIISEAAPEGFNPMIGDWAERLYRSQATTLAALSDHKEQQK